MNTKLRHIILGISLFFLIENLFGQTNQASRLFVPYLDEESQSNVIVTVSGMGQPCPLEYTNTLSNTNLFTLEQQKVIADVFIKYKNVTTNSGPPGTMLFALYRTNYAINVRNKTVEVEDCVADFKYTNFDAQEQVVMDRGGLSAKFRTKSNDGYNMYFIHTGNGTMLRFTEQKNGLANGVLAAFEDMHSQGTNWSFKLADFTDSRLTEYRHYTNGMVLGKFFMWNPRNGNLIIEAEFKEPYDWKNISFKCNDKTATIAREMPIKLDAGTSIIFHR